MISVIMSTYNEPIEYIEEAIDSILKQTYKDFEFIVVIDNPDRDDLYKYLTKASIADQRIKLIINDKNIGLTASLNKAIEISKGKYIARMDADDISEPSRLETQLNHLIKNKCQLVGSCTRNIDESGKMIGNRINYYPGDDKIIKKYLRYNSPLAHPTWLGKASLFKKYKYIDFEACEDYEFLTRIALDGNKISNVDKPLLKYRINSTGVSGSKRAKQKTSLFYISKNYRHNKRSDLKKYGSYINSKKGKKVYKQIKDYYDSIDTIQNHSKNRKVACSIIMFIKLVITNRIASSKIIYSLICKMLRLLDRKKRRDTVQ